MVGRLSKGYVNGIYLVNGNQINYEGPISIGYGQDNILGYYRTDYNEIRNSNSVLPNQLTLEVIFLDDYYFRWHRKL